LTPALPLAGLAPSTNAPPAWLGIPARAKGSHELAVTANWIPDAGHDDSLLGDGLKQAWDHYSRADYIAADNALEPVQGGLGESWLPSETADGLRTWHWLRLIHELRLLDTGESMDRRRAATSAFQLAMMCVPDAADLNDRLLADALQGLLASDPVSIRALCAYSVRAIRAADHEYALSLYDNSEKANLRKQWRQHFRLEGTGPTSTVEMSSSLVSALNMMLSELRQAPSTSAGLVRLLADVGRRLDPFLDVFEDSLYRRATELVIDTHRALQAETLDHRDALDLKASIADLMAEIACSSSLLLQDHLTPCLLTVETELSAALATLGDTSRPAVAASLQSSRLPFSATSGTPYAIGLLMSNVGNATAHSIRISLECKEIGLSTEAQLTALGSGAESVIEVPVTATGMSQTAVQLSCVVSWKDGLEREFQSTFSLTAEDQGPATWTDTDVNPFSLKGIDDPARLVGRDQDLNQYEALLAGGGSAYVTGQKRVGKTSLVRVLLKQVNERRRMGVSHLPLGRALATKESAADLVYSLLEAIHDAIKITYPGSSANLPDVDFSPDDNFARVANRWLRSAARSLPDHARVVIAVDDFDELPASLAQGVEADALFLFLRSLVDERWLNLILVGSEILPTLIKAQEHKLNQVLPFSVTNFQSRSSTEALLVTPTRDRLEWDDLAIDRVHTLCGGNPYYETLVASQTWQEMRNSNRSFVTSSDIGKAVSMIASTAPTSHFVHLWGDSPILGMQRNSRSAIVSSAILRAVARIGGALLIPANLSEVIAIAREWIQSADRLELEVQVRELVARGVLCNEAGTDRFEIAIPLVALWLQNAGARTLDAEYAATDFARAMATVVTANDLADLSRGLIYVGEPISEIRISAWLNQFGDGYQQYLAYLMLRRMIKDGYFNSNRLETRIMPRLLESVNKSPASRLIRRDGPYMRNGYLVAHGVPGDSTQGTLTSLSKALKIKKANILTVDATADASLSQAHGGVAFILDDFCGSGSHLGKVLEQLVNELETRSHDWRERVEIVIGAAVVASLDQVPCPRGLKANIHKVSGIVLGDRFRPFAEGSGVFGSPKEAEDANNLTLAVGSAILPRSPLGYGGEALLVLFDMNCPNNAAPMFWCAGKKYGGREWVPIFPRAT
jgi:hypothetical protein